MKSTHLVMVGVAVAVVAALLLLHFMGLAGQVTESTAEVVYLLRLEVEGAGSLLVNGTSTGSVSLMKPFKAVVEATPGTCHVLKRLLVNGSSVEGSSIELYVSGNTTVKALFEKPLYNVRLFGDAVGTTALVNGSIYALPAELDAEACSVLNITPVAPQGYKPLNGSLLIRVQGDVELRLSFRKVVKLELTGVRVPVEVLYSGGRERVEDHGVIEVWWGESVYVKLVDVDERGCRPFNETLNVCHVGWWNGSVKLYMRYLILNASSSTTLEQLVLYAPKHLPPLKLEIPTPQGKVEVIAYPPHLDFIVPITGSYRYLGDGWVEFTGKPENLWALFIEMPPWRKLKITCLLGEGAIKRTEIEVIVRTEPAFMRVGRIAYGEEVVYIIDWMLVERYKNESDVPLHEFVELFKCVKGCDPELREQTIVGPTEKRYKTPVKVGWLVVSGYGYAIIRIEVLESP